MGRGGSAQTASVLGAMSGVTFVFKPDVQPPGTWEPGATVPLRGSWWFISQSSPSEEDRKWRFEAQRTEPLPANLPAFDKDNDPGWQVGDRVNTPTGLVEITERRKLSFTRVGFVGRRIPPDTADIEALLE